MAQIKGTNVVAPVVPLDTNDVHPSHEARYGRGGYRTVATIVERDAIPAPRREEGMLVFVVADGKAYKLAADLTTWAEFKSGASSWAELDGKPAAFPPSQHGHAIAEVSGLSAALDGKQAAGSYVLTTDARLSDARQPLTHTHTASQISDFTSAVIAAAPPATNASLLTSGTLPDARLSSNIARTSDVTAAVANVVGAAPQALDTLAELGAALGNDASFASTVTNSLAGKAALVHTHTVSAITDAGTAATRNAPATGNAGATEVVLGSDTRLTDARTPTGHSHGNINNIGQLSSPTVITAVSVGGPVAFTALGGNIGRGEWGVAAGTFCQGNDSRLSDARTPTAHNQAWTTITSTPTTLAGYGITDAASASHAHTAAQITDFATAVAAVAPQFAVRSDTVSNISYIGRATSGTATSASTWTIRRTTVAAAGTVTTATASNVAWDNRLTASYS